MPTPQLTVVSVRPATLEANNILALRLMHHYTVTFDVNQSLSLSKKDLLARNLWKVEIPSIAFTSEVVLNALLGISAWHLWSLNPDDEQLITASRIYFGHALKLQRLALQQTGAKRDLPPVFIASIILAHLSWLLSHSDEHADTQPSVMATFYLCSGMRSLTTKVSPDWSKFGSLGLENVLETPFQPSSQERFMAEAAQDNNALLTYIQNVAVKRESKEVYHQVLRGLWCVYTLVMDDCVDVTTKEHTVVSHLHRVPPSFIQLLLCKEPLALALLARTYALLALMRNVSTAWYIHGAGKFPMYIRTVRSIQKLLTPEWMWVMDWPKRLISDDF